MGNLNSQQVASSYRNLFRVFSDNDIPYEDVVGLLETARPEDTYFALEKVNERGLDFDFRKNWAASLLYLEM